ncbi:exonuclease [Pseudomassariella vexata]|uniref:Exonuclease n=1 Tax=Pseudomassariella vexata TaxID=1141098 RepID=A0A1Y2ECP3_9PEZI|nr:exonuclease [Pseudomassariella vexata]ORY69064.1 exonuclease [Pseudomassariella vexata]
MATPTAPLSSLIDRKVSALTNSLNKVNVEAKPASGFIDTEEALTEVLNSLEGLPTNPPSLYVDLEGANLSRHGTISIMQLLIHPPTRRTSSTSTRDKIGLSLKDILESGTIPKVFFDVRRDSDTLFSHYGVRLSGIQDLQLMELATRAFGRRYVTALAKCIEKDANLNYTEKKAFTQGKSRGKMLFDPQLGGSYEVFSQRPLSEEILKYCTNDVKFLPRLWSIYDRKLTVAWRERVRVATNERVALSQGVMFNGQGQHMALAPVGWNEMR